MALTATTKQTAVVPKFLTITEVAFDSSYEAEGEPISAAALGLQSVDYAWTQITHGDEAKTAEQFIAEVYYEGGKLHAINAKTGKEVAGATNLEKLKVLVFALGKARGK